MTTEPSSRIGRPWRPWNEAGSAVKAGRPVLRRTVRLETVPRALDTTTRYAPSTAGPADGIDRVERFPSGTGTSLKNHW